MIPVTKDSPFDSFVANLFHSSRWALCFRAIILWSDFRLFFIILPECYFSRYLIGYRWRFWLDVRKRHEYFKTGQRIVLFCFWNRAKNVPVRLSSAPTTIRAHRCRSTTSTARKWTPPIRWVGFCWKELGFFFFVCRSPPPQLGLLFLFRRTSRPRTPVSRRRQKRKNESLVSEYFPFKKKTVNVS